MPDRVEIHTESLPLQMQMVVAVLTMSCTVLAYCNTYGVANH